MIETTDTAAPMHEGGCLCGSVRFTVKGTPLCAEWCHCRECQRSSGATAIPWAIWPKSAFHVTEGAAHLACFNSSYRGQRHFCRVCGATLHMVDPTEDDAGTVGVPATALDDPAIAPPTCHGWVSERVSWAHLDDGLPTHEKDTPE